MKKKIIHAVADYYSDKIKKFGNTPQGVDWNSDQSQSLRFLQLCKVLPENDVPLSLIDYGCGYGALYEFLSKTRGNFKYSGFDVSLKMVEAGQIKFEGKNTSWFTKEDELIPHDYIIASGIFNVKIGFSDSDWQDYILATLKKINTLAKEGFAFNILTSYSDKEYMKDYLYYADPSFYFNYCKRNFARNVALLHDYDLYEFSILVRK